MIAYSQQRFGKSAQDRRADALSPTAAGARAALETFYFAFNQRSLEVFDAVWAEDELIQLNNPLGGIQRGLTDIRALYRQIFEGPARVWVELHDIAEYVTGETAVFAGREKGEFCLDGVIVPLNIRTSRVYQYMGSELGWRQVHHHGSIDDPAELLRYQTAVRGQTHDETVTTIARVNVNPAQNDTFQAATSQLIEQSRKEAGVHLFDLYTSTSQPNQYLFHEIFNSVKSMQQHAAENHTRTWFDTVSPMLTTKPKIQHLSVVNQS